jgi:membrane protein YqaA with SNARE-associated domain
VLAHYVVMVGVVFAVNLLPAFGPPTWMMLVLFRLNWHLHPVVLVLSGAVAAGCGRWCLAVATRRVRAHLSQERQAQLRAAADYLTGHKARSVLGLGLFAVSPLPSAQLFEAAGLLDVPLWPLTGAFFAGRLVSYSFSVGATHLVEHNLGAVFLSAFSSPYGIAVQILLLTGIVLLARINWVKILNRHST